MSEDPARRIWIALDWAARALAYGFADRLPEFRTSLVRRARQWNF